MLWLNDANTFNQITPNLQQTFTSCYKYKNESSSHRLDIFSISPYVNPWAFLAAQP